MVGGRGTGQRRREEETEGTRERPSVPGAPAPGDLTGSPRALRTLTLFPLLSDLHWAPKSNWKTQTSWGKKMIRRGVLKLPWRPSGLNVPL